jgi:putative aldouronate transport system substrate-binding protein
MNESSKQQLGGKTMKNFKNILCLVLALVMVLGLAACGKKQAEETKPAETKPAETKPAEGGETTPADPFAEAVELTWVLNLPAANTAQAEVEAELKRIVKEAINVDLKCEWLPNNDYFTQLGTIVTTGSGWDIACVNGALFNANVGRNAFLDLKPYLDNGTLATVQTELPADALTAGAFGDGIYAISSTKDIGSVYNNIINVEMLDKIGIPVPEERPTRRSLYEWEKQVNAKFREDPANAQAHPLFGCNTNMFNDYFFDTIIAGNSAMGAMAVTNVKGLEEYGCGDKTDVSTVYCTVFTPEFEQWMYERYDMTADGVIYGYPAQDSDPKWFQNGDMMMNGNQGLIELDPDTYMGTGNFHVELYNCTEGLIYTGYLHAGMYAINAACENPDRAAALMEMMYASEEIHNLLAFGIEGADKDWTDVDNDGVIEFGARNQDAAARAWYAWYPFRNCAVMVGKAAPGSSPEFIQHMRDMNNSMTVSQNVGFVVDQTNIQTEVAALTNVMKEYQDRCKFPITLGSRENVTAMIEELRAKLTANGIEKVLAEVQAQLDAFHAGK